MALSQAPASRPRSGHIPPPKTRKPLTKRLKSATRKFALSPGLEGHWRFCMHSMKRTLLTLGLDGPCSPGARSEHHPCEPRRRGASCRAARPQTASSACWKCSTTSPPRTPSSSPPPTASKTSVMRRLTPNGAPTVPTKAARRSRGVRTARAWPFTMRSPNTASSEIRRLVGAQFEPVPIPDLLLAACQRWGISRASLASSGQRPTRWTADDTITVQVSAKLKSGGERTTLLLLSAPKDGTPTIKSK